MVSISPLVVFPEGDTDDLVALISFWPLLVSSLVRLS